MIGLLELLVPRGLDTSARIKLVRHEDARVSMDELRSEQQFDWYQSFQGRPIFNCAYIVSFIGQPHRRAQLYGVFRVLDHHVSTGKVPQGLKYPNWARCGQIQYDLERLDGFADLEDRVIIDWGASTRSWHQWLRDKEVAEILPSGYVREFPGYLDFVLSYDELRAIVHNPVANREWHRMLRAVAGVYLIVDRTTGRQYVGSACGEGGIAQRWASYVHSGHGGNKMLKELLAKDEKHARHFAFTVLQTLPRTATPAEVVACETLHKLKLGSRHHGFNPN